MSKRRYAVLGLGQFGRALAHELTKLGCEVFGVDAAASKVDRIRDDVAHAAVADIRDPVALKEIFSRPFDAAIIAIGGSIEASIMATLYLKDMGVKKIWVEASTADRAEVLKRVGATRIITPELDIGRRMAQRLANPNLLEYLPLTSGYGVVETESPKWTHGKTLAELNLRAKHRLAVIAIRSADDIVVVVPGGETKLQEGDVVTLVGRDGDIAAFQASKG